jgi:sn-glycerol 3-phosphate transport system substrate-binding protein
MRRRHTARSGRSTGLVAAVLVASFAAACSSGSGSLQNAGNTTIAPATTAAPGGTDTTAAPGTTAAPSTTAATPLDSLPPCPTDALAAADSPVELTFWHGMTAELEKQLTTLTDQYNASQSAVKVTLQNQGGYEQVIDKYLQSGQGSRPELVQAPEYAVQSFRDTNSFIPVEACAESAGFDRAVLLPSAVNAYSTGGVQWAMPFNVSNPVLFYNKKIFAPIVL